MAILAASRTTNHCMHSKSLRPLHLRKRHVFFRKKNPGAEGGRANRIARVTDESGWTEFWYGALGETIMERRKERTSRRNVESRFNSNSFVSGILRSAGLTPPTFDVSTPGYYTPIPIPSHE